jgi:uncharacterized membrane protein YcaP (DUF421 family)
MDEVMFFHDGWEPIARVAFITAAGYMTLVLLLRVTGQRTLSQMSAFDFVITVTLGSAFGRVITATEVSYTEALTGFAMLVSLQWAFATLYRRFPGVRRVAVNGPALVYYDGEVLERAMRLNQLRQQDLLTAVRQQGMGSLGEARAIVLESNGSFTVMSSSQYGDGSAVDHLRPPQAR